MPEAIGQHSRVWVRLTWELISFCSPSMLMFVHLLRPPTHLCYSKCSRRHPGRRKIQNARMIARAMDRLTLGQEHRRNISVEAKYVCSSTNLLQKLFVS